jgi:hypothetical protein
LSEDEKEVGNNDLGGEGALSVSSEGDSQNSTDPNDSAEVVEFLKLVEQARAEGDESAAPEELPAVSTSEPWQQSKSYKFGLKKKANESADPPRTPIQVVIREVQETPISPYISIAAILVAIFVAFTAIATTGL